MKKTILVCILIMTLVLTGCKKAGEAEQTTEMQPEAAKPKELVSDLKCVNNKMSGKITNTGSESVNLVTDLKVMVRGLVVAGNLLECEKMVLKPGESTYCSNLIGVYPVIEENRVLIRMGSDEKVTDVSCR